MKKLIPILLLCCFTFGSRAQIYVPMFADSTTQWGTSCFTSPGCCCHYGNTVYGLNGDTTIGINTYAKVWEWGSFWGEVDFMNDSSCYFPLYFSPEPILRYLVREDNKRVYMRYNQQDTLLYDFNLGIGDTIPNNVDWLAHNTTDPVIIISIDSVLVGTQYRKRYHYVQSNTGWPNGPDDWIIEGIGAFTGPFGALGNPFETRCGLTCYETNGITQYGTNNCVFHLGATAIENTAHQALVYPNPVTENTILDLNDLPKGWYTMSVYNSNGKLIKQERTKERTIALSKEMFTAGLFYYTLQSDEVQVSGKFIVN
jgi:hypothetical protein